MALQSITTSISVNDVPGVNLGTTDDVIVDLEFC